MDNQSLTQEQLKSVLDYNPETGVFTRKKQTCNKVKIGQIAGSLHKRGYWVIRVNNIKYGAHRLAWLYVHGKLPDHGVDHINGIKTDNRISNLRDIPQSGNNQNKLAKGCYYIESSDKWVAKITTDGKQEFLGTFDNEQDARNAYIMAKAQLHPYARATP